MVRHLLITSITSLFLACVQQRLKKSPVADGLPGEERRRRDDPRLGDDPQPARSLFQTGL